MNLKRFEIAVLALRPGETLVYHEGDLAAERSVIDISSARKRKPLTKESKETDEIAGLAFGLSLIGAAELSQFRIAKYQRKYRLRAKQKINKGDLTAAIAANAEDDKLRSAR